MIKNILNETILNFPILKEAAKVSPKIETVNNFKIYGILSLISLVSVSLSLMLVFLAKKRNKQMKKKLDE